MTTQLEPAGVYTPEDASTGARPHALVLAVLLVGFVGRVAVQFAQRVRPVDWLPSVEQWQSGALPYGMLLAGQVAIIGAQWAIIVAVVRERVVLGPRGRRTVNAFAVAYLAVMSVRLVVGSTVASTGSWFDAPLPTAFHLLLATFLFVWLDADRRDASVWVLRRR